MNFKHLFGNVYWVKNQNGLNNALAHYTGCEKPEVKKALMNWPDRYPAKIAIECQMFECNRVYVDSWVYAPRFIDKVNKVIRKMEGRWNVWIYGTQ